MAEHPPFELQLSALFEGGAGEPSTHSDLDPYTFRVLTVCTGNICRSPLAELLLRDQLSPLLRAPGGSEPLVQVSSSGLGALLGSGIDPEVRALAEGLVPAREIDAHRARQFSPEHAETAHLILTATRAQRDELASLAPSAGSRCFTLGELARLCPAPGAPGAPDAPGATGADAAPRRADAAGIPIHRPSRASRRLQRLVAEANSARQTAPGDAADDIDDPFRGSPELHRRVAAEIRDACATISAAVRRTLA